MISKTKINERIKRKRNPNLVETINVCKKSNSEKWNKVAQILSSSTKKRPILNLDEIDKQSDNWEVIVIPGKVLSQGKISKKIKIIAFSFSENSIEKLKNGKIEFNSIIEEIKSNPKGDKIKILGIKK